MAALVTGCVGGGGSFTADGGDGSTGCVACGLNCFDCGGGCQCTPDGGLDTGGPWVSPFSNTGEDGTWRNDTPTLCLGSNSLERLDLWSDERGVYVLAGGSVIVTGGSDADAPTPPLPEEPPIGGFSGGGAAGMGGFGGTGGGAGCSGERCLGEAILFNDGERGWQRIHQRQHSGAFAQRQFSGMPLGPLVLHGPSPSFLGQELCVLGRFSESDGFVCDRASGPVHTFFGVNANLAYATMDRELLRFDGDGWSVSEPSVPSGAQALWADQTDLVVAGFDGVISRLRDGAWTSADFGDTRGRLVWGNAIDDLWIVDFDKHLLHFDGVAVTELAQVQPGNCFFEDVTGMWGAGDTVYLYNRTALWRWNGSTLETLGNWGCGVDHETKSITRVWGNGPNEVFVALTDFDLAFNRACGDGIVLYFDGENFHAL